MNDPGGYGQFCPVAMAADLLDGRWTLILLRELLMGSTRFNDLRRGLPRMSPALLSKRLKELEAAGLVNVTRGPGGSSEYRLAEAGEELRPLILGLGAWGQRWIETRVSLRNLDPSLLMWDMRRGLNLKPMPDHRCTIQFLYPELPQNQRAWWIVVDQGKADLCQTDPGFQVDLLVEGPLRSMTMVWMGLTSLSRELAEGRMNLDGDPKLARTMHNWLGLSAFARIERRVS